MSPQPAPQPRTGLHKPSLPWVGSCLCSCWYCSWFFAAAVSEKQRRAHVPLLSATLLLTATAPASRSQSQPTSNTCSLGSSLPQPTSATWPTKTHLLLSQAQRTHRCLPHHPHRTTTRATAQSRLLFISDILLMASMSTQCAIRPPRPSQCASD